MKSAFHNIVIFFGIVLVSACATDTLDPDVRNHAPIASAGPDRVVEVGELVLLDAHESFDPEGDELIVRWELSAPEASAAQLSSTNFIETSFTPDLPGEYRITLVASDGQDDSAPDTILVTASGEATNQAPRAEIRSASEVVVGEPVWLDGSQSHDPDGDPLTFAWQIETVPEGSEATLDAASSPTPHFVADVAGPYEIRLVVSDGQFRSEAATHFVTATQVEDRPPVAVAGSLQAVKTGSIVTLDASGSYDPEGQPLRYTWSLLERPSTSEAVLNAADVVRPSFRADSDGEYVAQLIVSDGATYSEPATVRIVAASGNVPPVARAGSDRWITTGSSVTLDGRESYDADGDPLQFRWRIVSTPGGSAASLDDRTSSTPSFVADRDGVYRIELTVRDETTVSEPDMIRITASAANKAPEAEAGADQTVVYGTSVQLDASQSTDPDGDPLQYMWSLIAKPAGSAAALSASDVARPSLTTDRIGHYVVQLIVSDGGLDSMPDTVTIHADAARPSVEGDVVLTELMPNPASVRDADGEWFELHNPTAQTWQLRGCTLSDLGSDSHTIAADLRVAPGGYVTLARSSGPGFTPDYVYSGFLLTNTIDAIIVTCGSSEIAQVLYDGEFPLVAGASMSLLTDRYDEIANDAGANWCLAQSAYFQSDRGTPGADNGVAGSCP